jgi:hypothetical protein
MKQINFREQIPTRELIAGIWASFWLLVLTTGEPDLLAAIVGFIVAHSG